MYATFPKKSKNTWADLMFKLKYNLKKRVIEIKVTNYTNL